MTKNENSLRRRHLLEQWEATHAQILQCNVEWTRIMLELIEAKMHNDETTECELKQQLTDFNKRRDKLGRQCIKFMLDISNLQAYYDQCTYE